MAQQLKARVAFAEDLGSVPNTYMVTFPPLTSMGTRHPRGAHT